MSTTNPKIKNLHVATLFSGIGAFEESLKQIGVPHRIEFACDNGERYIKTPASEIEVAIRGMNSDQRDTYIREMYAATGRPNLVKNSYFANYEIDEQRWFEDVRFMRGKKYRGKLDFLVGGSPCQSFSVMGKHKGFEEARGTLFYDFARMVDECRPKVFIYENVKGLLLHDQGRTWEVISNIFDNLGYVWKHWVLNASDFGLAQNRVRVFVVGYQKKYKPFFKRIQDPKTVTLTKTVEDYLEKQVDNKYYLPEKGFRRVINPDESKHVALNGRIARCQVACQQYNWFGDMRFESVIPKRIENDKRVYKGEYKGTRGVARCLTPRECLRLMGFSDNFTQVVPDQYMYRQVGNSIAVNVMKAVVEEVIRTGIFNNEEKS